MIRGRDITGEQFGRLTAVSPTKQRYQRNIIWLCKCSCGNEKLVSRGFLIAGGAKSCGCLKRESIARASVTRTLPYEEASFNALFSGYKQSAKNRKYSFELTREQFKEFTKQNCFYCGCEPYKEFECAGKGNFNGNYVYNGVDRADNSKGYTLENCVSCCEECNFMKRNLNKKEFITKCKIIAENF
jgi:hypothetical protein